LQLYFSLPHLSFPLQGRTHNAQVRGRIIEEKDIKFFLGMEDAGK